MVKRKKKNSKTLKNNNGLAKIATITTKSLSNAFSNYKKNKELGKIKAIKLQKLEEKNQLFKERKDLIPHCVIHDACIFNGINVPKYINIDKNIKLPIECTEL